MSEVEGEVPEARPVDDASYLSAVAAFLRTLGRMEAADRLNGIAAAVLTVEPDQWTAARRFFG